MLPSPTNPRRGCALVLAIVGDVMLATAADKRQGLTSKGEGVVNRVTTAIADAIVRVAAR